MRHLSVAFAMLFALLPVAAGHEFFEYYCCEDEHCAAVGEGHSIRQTDHGWFVPKGVTIRRHDGGGELVTTDERLFAFDDPDIRHSPDLTMYLCIEYGRPKCLYLPAIAAAPSAGFSVVMAPP